MEVNRTRKVRFIVGAILALLLTPAGCMYFDERSFPMHPRDISPTAPSMFAWTQSDNAREWLRRAHATLDPLLPPDKMHGPPLLTEDMSRPAGKPIDVFARFNRAPSSVKLLNGNYSGYLYTGQLSARQPYIEETPEEWPGFEPAWIPIDDSLQLAARIGWVRDGGQIRATDCIVVLSGFFGDNGALRGRDVALALREMGYHVCAVELRGHGQTEAKFPQHHYTFGVFETSDMMKVSEWLQAFPHVTRTGLIGFSWSANIALYAAWYDGCEGRHEDISPRVAAALPPFSGARHFTAGVMSFSPAIRWEEFVDAFNNEYTSATDPIMASLQSNVRLRAARKGYTDVGGNLGRLIEREFQHTSLNAPEALPEVYRCIRLLPHRGKPVGDKLESARIPVLIVHAVNDPVVPAQEVVDLISTVDNPNVAAVILPRGGHMGFVAYSRRYYYRLIASFFGSQGQAESTWVEVDRGAGELQEGGGVGARPRSPSAGVGCQ